MCRFLPAPSVRKATHYRRPSESVRFISIHALREEGDRGQHLARYPLAISIHALREEGDSRSTPPFRRPRYFYPRPPRGGRPRQTVSSLRTSYFYPRPPRGGRRLAVLSPYSPAKFLSTLSARRATDRQKHSSRTFTISIHALREEGDSRTSRHCSATAYFYPRPPRGGRRRR